MGFRLTESDAPLVEARKALGVINPPFTKAKTLSALKAARTQNAGIHRTSEAQHNQKG
jgi:hypothetical protein